MNNNDFKEHKNQPIILLFGFTIYMMKKYMVARCKTCSRIIKDFGKSTSELHTHLKPQHNIKLLKRKGSETNSNSPKNDITKPDTHHKLHIQLLMYFN